MRYLYIFLELILYGLVAGLFVFVFSRYRYCCAFEKRIEQRKKTSPWLMAAFLTIIGGAVLVVFFTWQKLYPNNPHHMGYFLAFLVGTIMTLAFFRQWIDKVDLKLCVPSIGIVWALLLIFETFILVNKCGWIYTDSTVLSIPVYKDVSIILENVIFFYTFSPFISILIFTGLAHKRSDKTAFLLTNLIVWACGAFWEYTGIAIFNLWTMAEDRSILPVNLFGARTTIEELLYYLPFVSVSILVYLLLYYRKYRYAHAYERRRP